MAGVSSYGTITNSGYGLGPSGLPSLYAGGYTPPPPKSVPGQYNTAPANATGQQPAPNLGSSTANPYAGTIASSTDNYNNLMQQYQGIANNPVNAGNASLIAQYGNKAGAGNNPITATPLTYEQSPDLTAAMSNLSGLSQTGGYSPQMISDLRNQATQPITAAASSAMQNIERQKALQGGYSPNETAALATLPQQVGQGISNAMTNANATIDQNVTGNRLAASVPYTQAAGQQTGMMNNINSQNVSNQMAAQGGNAALQNQALGSLTGLYGQGQTNQLSALDAMSRLYGTTPAQPALYGGQAAQQAGLNLQQQQMTNNSANPLIAAYAGMR